MRNWIYLLLLLPSIGTTQSPLLDSLQQRLANPPTILHEIDTWLGLARLAVFDGDFDRVEECTNRAFQLSEQENYLAGKAKALLYQSQAKGQTGATEESLMLIQQGLELARQSGDLSTLLLAQYQLAEDYLYNKNQDVKALAILTKATEIDESRVSPKTIGNIYKNIGQCYLYRRKLEQAEQAFLKALDYLERPYLDPNLSIVSATEIDEGKLNEGQLYLYLLDVYDKFEEDTKAIEMGEKALELYKDLELKSCIAWAYEELSYLMRNIGDLGQAIQYLQAATKIYEALS
ncbi:MAG: hypothetical protein AAGG68_29390, partial [Bacteroidota bacterium]